MVKMVRCVDGRVVPITDCAECGDCPDHDTYGPPKPRIPAGVTIGATPCDHERRGYIRGELRCLRCGKRMG